jgi:molybdopterin-guanine dinucleotide biosynthesis protein B
MGIPIISIVGRSNSGKTTLIEKIIPELKKRGYKVGTIKHDAHGFEIDYEGKDTYRHFKAGTDTVVIASSKKMALIKRLNHSLSLDELVERFFQDMDIVITEGYKTQDKPKIEVFRSEVHDKPVCTDEDNRIALVSDKRLEIRRNGMKDDRNNTCRRKKYKNRAGEGLPENSE